MSDEIKVKSIAPSIQSLIIRDLGAYGGMRSGVNKHYYLMNVIYNLYSYLSVNYGEETFLKEVENELKGKKSFPYKTWKEIDEVFKKIRPILNEIQMVYDDIKEMKGKKDSPQQSKFRKLSKKISPYQPEIYFVFNVLMKISGIQRLTIPKGAFRTPEQDKYSKVPFDRKTKFEESKSIVKDDD